MELESQRPANYS